MRSQFVVHFMLQLNAGLSGDHLDERRDQFDVELEGAAQV